MLRFKKKNLWLYAILVVGIYFSVLYYHTNNDYKVLVQEEKNIHEQIEYEKIKQNDVRK